MIKFPFVKVTYIVILFSIIFSLFFPTLVLAQANVQKVKVDKSTQFSITKDSKGLNKLKLNKEYIDPSVKSDVDTKVAIEDKTTFKLEKDSISEVKTESNKVSVHEKGNQITKEINIKKTTTIFKFSEFSGNERKNSNLKETGKVYEFGNENLRAEFNEISKTGINYFTKTGNFNIRPLNANFSKPEKINGNDIIYKNVWDGIDIVYQYDENVIKDYIIINKTPKNFKLLFETKGISLNTKNYKIDMKLGDEQLHISDIVVFANKIGPVSTGVKQYNVGSKIVVEIDRIWLSKFAKSNYPISIDPGVVSGERYSKYSGSGYSSFKSDGYKCLTQYCDLNTGGLYDKGYKNWRAYVNIDFSELVGKNTLQVLFDTQMSTNPYRWNGNYSTNSRLNITWASCNGFNCIDPRFDKPSTVMTSGGSIDITNTVKQLLAAGATNGDFIIWGDENTNNTFKAFDLAKTKIRYIYNNYPGNNASVSSPVNGQVVVTDSTILSINAASDPDGDALYYTYQLSDKSGTVLQTLVDSTSTSMTISDGILQDGETYTWKVYVRDSYFAHQNPAFVSTFKVDYRLGKDKVQTYDEVGPVSVSLQSGNAYTSIATHSLKALGGNIGLNLEFNSPVASKNGLSGRYFNNVDFIGEPVYRRIDSELNFNWNLDSPIPNVVNKDGFGITWNGYFVPPTSGNYKLGSNNDDGMTIWLNGQELIHRDCCGEGYSSPRYLEEGKPYPIQINYVETGGPGAFVFKMEHPNGRQETVPTSYLRSNPVEIYERGLVGSYYFDNGTHDFNQNKQKFLTRNEPVVNYNWGGNSPVFGGPTDKFMASFSGYVNIPISGSYNFATSSDDGTRLYLNDNLIVDNWGDHGMREVGSNSIYLTAGSTHKIRLDYFEGSGGAGIELKWKGPISAQYQIIENKYLSPKPLVVPNGWNLTNSTDFPFEKLKLRSNGDIVMITSDDSESLYTYQSGGYKPPINEEGIITKNSDNSFTFLDSSGTNYIFADLDTSGYYKIKEVSTPYDDKNPAALKFVYSAVGGVVKLKEIVDSVDPSRKGIVYYQGESQCTTANVPTGYLCKFVTSDSRETSFVYQNGKLSEIWNTGGDFISIGSTSGGNLLWIRDAKMNEVVSAGLRSADSGSIYLFEYDILGRVNAMSLPSLSGSSSLKKTIEYFPNNSKLHLIGGGNTEPHGFTTNIEYDNLLRTTKVCDKLNLCTTTQWDSVKDLILSTTDALAQKSTVIYDSNDLPVESYGPAPVNYFGTDRKPLANYIDKVKKVTTEYDGNINGFATAFYDFKGNSPFGTPKLHQLGLHTFDPSTLWYDYRQSSHKIPVTKSSGMDGVGVVMTGLVKFPNTQNYTISAVYSDSFRMWIDDKLVVDAASNRNAAGVYSNTSFNFSAMTGKSYRIKIDWGIVNTAPLLNIVVNGSANWNGLIKPNYNLVTKSTVFDKEIGNIESTTTFSNPAYGIVDKSTIDPLGLNYSSTSTVEAVGTGYFRTLSSTTAGGSVTSYAYYGNTEQRINTCDNTSSSQAGFLKSITKPDGSITEIVYDKSGRVVATKRTDESKWNCILYDNRGRVIEKSMNSDLYGSEKVTYSYNFGGNPLKSTITNSNDESDLSESDFLGNLIRYSDGFGVTTSYSYDILNRLTKKQSDFGSEEFVYDSLHRVINHKIDGVNYATVNYDNFGRVSSITYPQSGQLSMLGYNYDEYQRAYKINWRQQNGTLVSEEITRSQSGIITNQKFTQGANVYSQGYTYDKVGRLTKASYSDRSYSYNYADNNACAFKTSNKNYNRTSDTVTIGSATVTNSYCYDVADRLISSTNYGVPEYDKYGNTTKIGSISYSYNIYGKVSDITEGANNLNWGSDSLGRRTVKIFNSKLEEGYYYTSRDNSADYILDYSTGVFERIINLPGIQFITSVNKKDYNVLNSKGNLLFTNNSSINRYGPFGEKITENTGSLGFGATQIRLTESRFSYQFIDMGARIYLPSIGRFLIVDPVRGGTQNDFVYPVDPINGNDFSGKFMLFGSTPFILFSKPTVLPRGNPFLENIGKVVKVATESRNNTVYRDAGKGSPEYIGRTIDLIRRGIEHNRSVGREIQPIAENLTKSEAKGLEQVLIEEFGMAKNGGSLSNLRNEISQIKPNYKPLTDLGRIIREAIDDSAFKTINSFPTTQESLPDDCNQINTYGCT